MRRGEVYIWSKRRPDGSISRILCSIANRTGKNVQITRWAPKVRMYVNAWASPESLSPATEAEKRQFERLANERKEKRNEISA